jgi:hypothetical protein
MAYQFLRGTTAQNDAYTGPVGSLTLDLERNTIRVHDGVTPGGASTIENIDHLEQLLSDKAGLSGGEDANFEEPPQVDGSPLITSGSNANGRWVRFFDGTLICTSSALTITASDAVTANVVWTFPSSFTSGSPTVVTFSVASAPPATTRERTYWTGTPGTTTVSLNMSRNSSWTTSETAYAQAIGLWK